MTISVSVLANPHQSIPGEYEGTYGWFRDYCEGDAMYPKTLTICANCVVLYFEEGESFLIPLHRINEIQWEELDNVIIKEGSAEAQRLA